MSPPPLVSVIVAFAITVMLLPAVNVIAESAVASFHNVMLETDGATFVTATCPVDVSAKVLMEKPAIARNRKRNAIASFALIFVPFTSFSTARRSLYLVFFYSLKKVNGYYLNLGELLPVFKTFNPSGLDKQLSILGLHKYYFINKMFHRHKDIRGVHALFQCQ